jgi:PAS domain S-box-containing protein
MRDEEKTPQQLLQELQSLRQRLAISEAERSRPQETEAHLLALLEQLPVTVWATDRDFRITHSVGAGLAAIGLQPHQLVGQTLFQYFQTDDPDFWFIRHTRQALTGESVRLESEWLGRRYQTLMEPLRKQNRIIGVVGVAMDITERLRAEESLRCSEGRLQALSRRLMEVQEQERRYFARELHDEVGQALTGLNLALETVARLPTESLRDGLANAQALAKETIAQVRELSMRLRPTMLDDLGLRPALLWHFNRYSTQTGVQVDFQATGLDSRLPAAVETAAYRILQEALTNVARHAGVGEVDVYVRHENGELFLAVEDQGAGFDAAAVRGTSGLSGMHERVTLLGGELTIESQPGAGTRLIATLPCGK